MITFYLEETCPEFQPFNRRSVSQWMKKVMAGYGKTAGDIAFTFCSDERILEVNRQFLQHDYYTDVITFDYVENDTISGDVFISIDTVKSNAEGLHVPFADELMRVMIHAVLHLCGQDDKTPEDRKVMTEKENRALAQF